jgi:hypothetical protein
MWLRDPGSLRDIRECSVAPVSVEQVRFERKATRSTCHGHAAIPAIRVLAGSGAGGEIKLQVIRDEQVQIAVAIIIQESAPAVVTRAILD